MQPISNEEAQTVGPGSRSPGLGSSVPQLILLNYLVILLVFLLFLCLRILRVTYVIRAWFV